ncbi:MAG: CBS domain-containing protein [Gammaproteobacteria bacterium]|nr:CBS domain-containing protein [Gammaproteobacteria bacterium]
MSAIPLIKSIMTPSPHAIEKDGSVEQAQKIMLDCTIRHLPVVENSKPIGILSDRDIALALLVNNGMETASSLKVEDICTLDAFNVDVNDTLDDIAFIMAEKHIGSVLVTDSEKLVGIFTATDACEYLGHCLRSKSA